ncbi:MULTISPECIES: cytochrome c [unclassified Ruegeria]|uniref:c-type cytochrome n=1 Tax=unclassified Ruegeria TaxID=2625375 RepID=UPI001ADB6CFD|nr:MULTISPECIES: cytochrome c [unclassified Ruegeria]MBO9411691.1 cytochrome c [Ruegeria sp. R8_1]MBO9415747.1 cytochrome c [Ruegeria sp. R8_2]
MASLAPSRRGPIKGWTARTFLTSAVLVATTAFAADTLDPAALKRLVHQDCGSCHGLTLKGGLGSDLRPETLEHYDLDVLTSVILDGIPDTAMPPWRALITDEEAEWIARYLLQQEDQ